MTPTFLDHRPKPGKYYDEHGLVVVVGKTRTIHFAQRYTHKGHRRSIPLGRYPELSLAGARALALANLRLVHAGKDPVAEKNRPPTPTLIEAIATVIEQRRAGWSNPRTEQMHMSALEAYVFPELGDRLVSDISLEDLVFLLKPVKIAAPSTFSRIREVLSPVMHWAIVNGFREDNPADERLTKALPKISRKTDHRPAFPHSQVADALAAIRSSDAWIFVKLGLEFLILTAVRSGEVRGAVWDEIDIEGALWTIPAARMKTDEEYLVPLVPQSISVLRSALEPGDGTGLVFPSKTGRMMYAAALSDLFLELRIPCVPHGMRSSFRDWCGETGVDRQVAEACLAHQVGDPVELAYLRWDFLARRRPVMEAWAAYVTSKVAPAARSE